MCKIALNWRCFCNLSGYSVAAQDMILALLSSGKYDIKVDSIGGVPARMGMSQQRHSILCGLAGKPVNPDAIEVFHCIPTLQRRIGKKNIGFATFETFDPPETWIRILNQNNAVIVPSRFNLEIFRQSKVVKPLFHIPHCLDFNMYNPSVNCLTKYEKFSFLFIGTWKTRKGYQELIEAWFSEFTEDDNVQLVIKTDKPYRAKAFIECFKAENKFKGKHTASVVIENRVFDESLLPQFIKSHNALIQPSYGEGFGLPGLQAMALGVPVIITDFSGCQDYANPETATLISPDGFKIVQCLDKVPQFMKKKWASLSPGTIGKAMRSVLDSQEIVKSKAEKAFVFVKENFSYEKTITRFDEVIGQINV